MTSLFHITHVRNLSSIITAEGVLCDTDIHGRNIEHVCIGYNHIKDRRAQKAVPLPPYGILADYVPFYFAARSPMLFTIHKGNVESYKEGQGAVLHLVSSVESIARAGIPYVFTDGHAVMAISRFFKAPSDLDKIDWTVMNSQYWYDTDDDNDRKRRRQAEFLIYQFCPWELIERIGVMNIEMQKRVESIIRSASHKPVVEVCKTWYY